MSTGVIFILCVLAMFPTVFLIAAGVKFRELFEARRWSETTGKVISSRVESLRKKSSDLREVTNQPFVQYEYTVGGRTYQCSRISVGIWSRVVFGDFSGGGLLLDSVLEDGPLDDFHQQRRSVQRSPTF